jgi:ketosteroid isomerase-like protein
MVESYFEGFRQSDHGRILGLLTDNVVWDLPGFKHLEGKEAFDGEIENPAFEGSPKLAIDRLVEEGDTVVAVGTGEGRHKEAGPFRFAYCDVFTFAGDLISRVESYVVPVGDDIRPRRSGDRSPGRTGAGSERTGIHRDRPATRRRGGRPLPRRV